MGKILKRSLSVLLVVLILLTSAPLRGFVGLDFLGMFSVSAEEIETNTVNNDDKLYYSELFYGYPYYIANDTYFDSYVNTVNGIYDSVYSSYINSEQVVGTGLEHALDTITSPTDIATLITDRLGLTSFSYNDALDAANEELVKHILSDSLAYSVEESYGKSATLVSELNTLIKYFNVFADESPNGIEYTVEYYLQEAFDFLHDKGCFSYVSTDTLANLWSEINDSEFSLNDCFDIAKNEIEFAQAIMTALVMEDNRLEIVNDILSTQNSDTVLKQGMTRLKTKMQNNFVECILKDYLVKKVADKLFGAIDGLVIDAIGGGELKIILGIVKEAFNLVVDVAKFDDVLKWQVLICYSKDLASGILSLAKSFDDGPFLSDLILKYERLFIGYDAVNKAAMESTTAISNMEDPFGAAYGVLSEAVANNISDITVTSGLIKFNIPSSVTEQELYDILTAGTFITSTGSTIKFGKEIKISNGLTTINVPIKANVWSSIMRGCLSENAQLIYAFKNGYGSTSLYGEHIDSVKSSIKSNHIPITKEVYSKWNYVIPSSGVQLRNDSDIIKSNSLYGLNNHILCNILVINNKSLTIPTDVQITVDGNMYLGEPDDSSETGTLTNNGKLTVTGSLEMRNYANIENNAELVIENKLWNSGSLYFRTPTIKNNGIIRTHDCDIADYKLSYIANDDSELYISGDVTANNWPGDNAFGGKIIFNGSETQSISRLYSTHIIDVQNKSGIRYRGNVQISGYYKLNGNPLYLNGYTTIAYNGARFDNSDYVRIHAYNLKLLDSVDADVYVVDNKTMTIPTGTEVTVDGNMYLGEPDDSGETGALTNNGKLTVTGSLEMRNYATVVNNAELVVGNKFWNSGSLYGRNPTIKNNGIIRTHDCDIADYKLSYIANDDSELYISGDVTANNWPGDNAFGGKIIFNGSETQSISRLNSTHIVDVQNKSGILYRGNVHISGYYKLNGNPLYLNGYTTYAYNGARFDNSDYVKLHAYNLKLLDSVDADVHVVDNKSLTIPAGTEITIDGNMYIGEPNDSYDTGTLINNGKLTITGSVELRNNGTIENYVELVIENKLWNSGTLYGRKPTIKNNGIIRTHDCDIADYKLSYTANNNSELYISGNFTADHWAEDKTYGGTIIFNGSERQSVSLFNASTIILENESQDGVVFKSNISPSKLFNHNRNKFTLHNNGSGSTFVDYDGDGKKDNIDPYPLDPTDGENDSDFELKMIDSKIYIVGYNGNSKDVVIPAAVGSYMISGIKDLNGDFIESITISESVETISSNAFDDLVSLKNIIVDLNNNTYASKDGILYSYDKSELVRCPIGYENSKVQLSETLEKISANAFKNCSLQEINLPNTLIDIGSYAFQYTKLTEITIPEAVVSIGKSAFANCLSLNAVQYNAANCSASYTNLLGMVLTETVFWGSSVNEITIGDNVRNIPNGIFAKSYIKSIVVPPNVEKIGAYAFADCTSLTNIYGYEGVVSIDKYAFSGCSSLGTTKIGYNVTTIGSNAFNNCPSLTIQCYNNTSALNYATSNSIPYEIIEVPLETIELNNQSVLKGSINALNYSIIPFYTSENIVFTSSNEIVGYFDSNNRFVADKCGQTVVTIASESGISVSCVVTVVGVEGAEATDFDYEIQDSSVSITGYTGNETEIVIPDTIAGLPVTYIDSDFGDSAFESITIGSNVTGISLSSFNKDESLKNIYVNSNNTYLMSIDGVLYSFDGKTVLKYPIGKTEESYRLPSTVSTIGAAAFYGVNLVAIDLSNITMINEASFSNSKLTQVIIPETVTAISDNTFANCTALEKIEIPHTVTSIGENVFSDCLSLVIYCYKNSAAYDYAVNNSIAYNLVELEADNIIVTGIQETIIDGRQCQLSAEISPIYTDENIVWSSSNSDVFTVSNSGLITAKGAGEAILTVASSRGSVSKTFNINVLGLSKDSENANLYHARNADDMLTLSTMVNNGVSFAGKIIQLDNDVDLSNVAWMPIGIDSTNVFSGVFDGNNHTISGLNYTTTSSTYSGLFGYIKTGGIKDLTIEGLVSGKENVGIFAGCVLDSALYNCKAIGEVKRIALGSYGYVGGLVGSALHSVIINCAAETDITVDFGTSSIYYAAVGGIAGVASTSGSEPMCILNSYCIGDISVNGNNYYSENYYVGGIAGYLKDDAANNYYFGEITNADEDSIKKIGYAFGYVVPEYTSESNYNGIGTIIVQDNYYLEGKNAIGLISEGDYDSSNWVSPISEENFSKLIGKGSLVDELNGNKGSVEDIIVAHRDILSNSTWAELVDRINGDSFTVSNWKIGSNNLPVNYECDCYRHAESDWVVDVEATCTKEGSKYTYCLVCQETVNTSIIEKAEHKFSDWTETKAATCTEKGSESRTCTACNSATETRDIAKLGHNFDGEWTTDKAATCAEKGSESRTCTRCKSEKETRTVDKLGHDFESEWTIDVEATCSKAGSKSHHCSRCDEKDDVTVINKIAHSYKESVQEATCTKDGKKTYNCSSCGDSYSEVITAQGHIDQNGDEKCDNCDYIYDNTCDHMCHKSGFMGFIWKIVRFFWKLFKMNPVCECGVAHY